MDQRERGHVNIKIDCRVGLEKIPDVKEEWETAHQIRALVIDARSPALDFLLELERKHSDDYRKIIKVAKLVAGQARVLHENHVKRGKRRKSANEMRAHKGHARLFFFYAQDGTAVCTHGYIKGKGSRAEQDQEFEKCERFREIWESHKPGDE